VALSVDAMIHAIPLSNTNRDDRSPSAPSDRFIGFASVDPCEESVVDDLEYADQSFSTIYNVKKTI
jgi:hypothetical protein